MLKQPFLALSALLFLFASAASAEVMEWKVDPVHSNIGFKVRHFGVSWVRGQFNELEGRVWFDKDDLSTLRMDVMINPASVDTGVERRDDHLRNPDFFEVETFKEMRFVSTKTMKQSDGTVKVIGDLTMHGQTHPVTLTVDGLTKVADPGSGPRTGASARAIIKRSEWGMTWVEQLKTGGVNVADDVHIEIEAELRPVQ